MDEVISYLVEELAMDGEPGSDLARFSEFIEEFHKGTDSLIDDSYRDYIFRCLFTQQSCVQVGTRVKAGKPPDKPPHQRCIDTVAFLPRDEVLLKGKTLTQLSGEHGNALRITVDVDLIRLYITGTTDAKLLIGASWPSVQLVSRRRARGCEATEIGRVNGADQRNVFAILKKLVDVGLVKKMVAVKKHGQGQQGNFVLHRRYWGMEIGFKDIVASGAKATKAGDQGDEDGDAAEDGGDADETQAGVEVQDGGASISEPLCLAIIAQPEALLERVLRQVEEDGATDGLWQRMGFPAMIGLGDHSLNDAIQHGVQLGWLQATPSLLALTSTGRAHLSRLSAPSTSTAHTTLAHTILDTKHTFAANLTFERQIHEAVRQAGSSGTTTRQVTRHFRAAGRAVRHFDEYMHTHETDGHDLRGYPDLSILSVLEMFGREKRVRMWNAAGLLAHAEEVPDGGFEEKVEPLLGIETGPFVGWAPFETCWESVEELQKAIDAGARLPATVNRPRKSEKDTPGKGAAKPTTTKRKKNAAATPTATPSKPPAPKKAPTPKKAATPKKMTNPIDPETGRPKKGRPRKSVDAASAVGTSSTGEPQAKRARGRPKKNAGAVAATAVGTDSQPTTGGEASQVAEGFRAAQAVPGVEGEQGQPAEESLVVEESQAVDESQQVDDSTQAEQSLQVDESQVIEDSQMASESQQVDDTHNGQQVDAEPRDADQRDADTTQATEIGDYSENSAPPTPSRPIKRRVSEVEAEAAASASASASDSQRTTPSATPARKRGRPSAPAPVRARFNIAQTRRERLFIEVLSRCSGLADEMNLGLLWMNELTQRHGENTQAVLKELGDLRDSKTRTRMLDSLVKQGKIKITTTLGPKGRQRKIVHSPDVDARSLREFTQRIQQGELLIGDVSQDFKHLSALRRINTDNVNEFDTVKEETQRTKETNELIRTLPVDELLEDPRHAHLFEASTLVRSTTYGFMAGEMTRLSFVHRHIMARLPEDGLVDTKAVARDLPLGLVVSLKEVENDNDAFKAALQDPERMARPILDEEMAVKSALGALNEAQFIRWFEDNYVQDLQLLRLATPAGDGRLQFKHSAIEDGQWSWAAGGKGSGSMLTLEDAAAYWEKLSKNRKTVSKNLHSLCEDSSPLRSMARLIGNDKRWRADKLSTSKQRIFLRRLVEWPDPDDWGSILRDENMLRRVSELIFAPLDVVKEGIAACKRRMIAQEVEQENKRRTSDEKRAEREALNFERLEKELQESGPDDPRHDLKMMEMEIAKLQRELKTRRDRLTEWTRVFEQACRDNQLEGVHRAALLENLLEFRDAYATDKGGIALDVLSDMIRLTVEQQGRPDNTAAKGKTKGKGKGRKGKGAGKDATPQEGDEDGGAAPVKRRRRRPRVDFRWTRERDELLRDACVIIRARDKLRGSGRSNWTALNQVFEEEKVPKLRARFTHLSAAIGEEDYLNELEAYWTRFWEEYRGTVLLRDPNPGKPDGFDLKEHIAFLRSRVDKDDVLEAVERAAAGDGLAEDDDGGGEEWQLREQPKPREDALAIVHDPHENAYTTTEKLNGLLGCAFTLSASGEAGVVVDAAPQRHRREHMAECVVRMLIESPDVSPEAGVALCRSVGEDQVEKALERMKLGKIVRKTNSEAARRHPGNNFAYTHEHSNLDFGPHLELARQALEAESALRAGEWTQIGMDDDVGMTIAAVQMLADGEAEAQIEVEQLAPLRDEIYFNGKAVVDADNEVDVGVRGLRKEGSTVAMSAPMAEDAVQAAVGGPLVAAGYDGVLASSVDAAGNLHRHALKTGYDDLRLVSPHYRSAWQVGTVDAAPPTTEWSAKPRSWLNASTGVADPQRWHRALLAVHSQLLLRPGLSLSQLSIWLGSHYDRVELREIVAGLEKMGLVEQRGVGVRPDAETVITPRLGGPAWYRFQSSENGEEAL
ncbi:hypothetical protein BDZ90DRAFT_280883 [Jaminaea rosea]|uniref:Uncharacterized protein n=1 Tax=Jaminaea rosea TaxID=1569628 RepID=A0A316UMC3_9BASI|nr:hypothetical protein BDZ90DRAFT_280883 [Jaminaea rosea]PWN26370.1 hypothetical protein BDZ90DRAFT_280883 [Jaminaea rosea]